MARSSEFALIARHFAAPAQALAQVAVPVALGIGDDCALLTPPPGQQLAVSTDTLNAGVHFFDDVAPEALGHKALAVNLSDLAACGAQPLGFTLALSLPRANHRWLAAFSRGLLALAGRHRCALVGGDTTRGPLSVTVTIWGAVPPGQALLRSGARAGDDVWVSGTLGDARLGLEQRRGTLALRGAARSHALARLERPTPRVALGLALRGVASACTDLSDGLAGDLGHILAASACGAVLDESITMNLVAVVAASTPQYRQIAVETRRAWLLAAGDDYELVFTAPPSARAAVQRAGQQSATPVTRIGTLVPRRGLWLQMPDGQRRACNARAFDHFA